MAGESGRRSESRCMTPFLLKPITCAMNLKLFEYSPKERPARDCAGLSPNNQKHQAGQTQFEKLAP